MFKKIFGQSVGELFGNKRFLVGFSIVCAIIFWLVIDISQNPVKTVSIADVPISITTENTAVSELGLDVVGGDINQKVTVDISGPNYIVSSLSKDDILVSASLAEVKEAGTYELSLIGTRNSSKIGYEIAGIKPEKISLVFDNVDTKVFDVEANAIGVSTPPDTMLVAENAIVSDNANKTVEITGARSVISNIKRVSAVANVNKVMTATESFDAEIILYDENDNEISKDGLTLSVSKPKITVPIYTKKTVPLVAVFNNAPEYYINNGVPHTMSIQGEKVTEIEIKGPAAAVELMTHVNLSVIDFANISPDKHQFECTLDLPNTVKTTDNTITVMVNVEIKNISSKTISVQRLTAENMAQGYSLSGNVIKNVVLYGSKTDIKSINASSVVAVVDLKDVGTGQTTVKPKFRVEGYDTVWVYGTDYDVSITVKSN